MPIERLQARFDVKMEATVIQEYCPGIKPQTANYMVSFWMLARIFSSKPLPMSKKDIVARAEHNLRLAEENARRIPNPPGESLTLRQKAIKLLHDVAV